MTDEIPEPVLSIHITEDTAEWLRDEMAARPHDEAESYEVWNAVRYALKAQADAQAGTQRQEGE